MANRVAALFSTPKLIPVLAAALAEIDPQSLHGTQRQIRHRMFQIRGRVLEILDHELLADDDLDMIISAIGHSRVEGIPGEPLLMFEPLIDSLPSYGARASALVT
ncbi:MAG: hypothetical protein JWO41_837 [Candidatus Saccharibacteria bacterium]|nr:hypothetical protein [Candidatus Saccharibacteria bacterium]